MPFKQLSLKYEYYVPNSKYILYFFSQAPPPPSNQTSINSLNSPRSSASSCDTNTSSNSGNAQSNNNNPPHENVTSSSGSGNSSTFGSPIREIPSIRSTKNHRGVGARLSHSFSVPLNLVSILRNNPTESHCGSNKSNGEASLDNLTEAE